MAQFCKRKRIIQMKQSPAIPALLQLEQIQFPRQAMVLGTHLANGTY